MPIPEGLYSRPFNIWDVFFVNPQRGYISTDLGRAYHTSDGGLNWSKMAFTPTIIRGDIKKIYFIDSLNGFLFGEVPLLKTSDGGASWVSDSSLFRPGIFERDIVFFSKNNGWILSADTVYRTVDGGVVWTSSVIEMNVDNDYNSYDLYFLNLEKGWVCTDSGLYATSDSGKTWTNINDKYIFRGIYFQTDKIGWATGREVLPEINNLTNKYFYTSDGGLTWEKRYNSITDYTLYDVDFIDENKGWAVGNKGEIINSTNGGKTWNKQQSNVTKSLKWVQFIDENNGWFAGWSGVVFATTDGGNFWKNSSVSGNYNIEAGIFISPNIGWIAGGDENTFKGVVFYTNDGGKKWTQRTPQNLYRLYGIHFVDSLNGWAVSGGSTISDAGEIYKTSDGGINWISQYYDPYDYFTCVFFIDSLTGWAGSEKGLLKTTDAGFTWEQKQVFDDFNAIYSFSFFDKNYGWANGLQGRSAYTKDGGETWQTEYPQSAFTFYNIDFINNKKGWKVGEFGSIIYTITGGINSVHTLDIPKLNFILYQNYPNPLNPSTTINYQIPHEGMVTIKVFDIIGNEITTLVNEPKTAGIYQAQFDAGNLSSGIYIYTIKVSSSKGGFIASKKMTLIK